MTASLDPMRRSVRLLPPLLGEALLTRARASRLRTSRRGPRQEGMRPPHAPHRLRELLTLPTAVAASPGAPGAEQAALALQAFLEAFYVQSRAAGGHFLVRQHARRATSFWQTAELVELVEDAWMATRDVYSRRLLQALWRGILFRYGCGWTSGRVFNDDVMWMVIAALRAYAILGERACLAAAVVNFQRAYARGWDKTAGGLWWTTACGEKNACVNGPAAIAACLLAAASRDGAFLNTAAGIYSWLRDELFDEETGRVCDRIVVHRDGSTALVADASTYNQGTFIGAADLLWRVTGEARYEVDARRALAFARHELTVGGILRGEGDGGDGGGFKGIFARYAVPFARRSHLQEDDAWLWRNAEVAWSLRDTDGLIAQDWTRQRLRSASTAPSGRSDRRSGIAAWDASSAVVLLQNVAAGGVLR